MDEIVDQYTGLCSVCEEQSLFTYFGGSVRESYNCKCCKASLRYRHQALSILEIYGDGEQSFKALCDSDVFRKLHIFEPGIIGPFRKFLKNFPNYTQSFYWEDFPLGESKDGIVNEDLQNLTLKSQSLDLIITSDIFEHIRKPNLAFKEIHRVLRKGGKHIFTIPVQYPINRDTIYRVDTSGIEDIHILPAHYHGNGAGGRSLVYTDFGKNLLIDLGEMSLSTSVSRFEEEDKLRAKNITFVSSKE